MLEQKSLLRFSYGAGIRDKAELIPAPKKCSGKAWAGRVEQVKLTWLDYMEMRCFGL